MTERLKVATSKVAGPHGDPQVRILSLPRGNLMKSEAWRVCDKCGQPIVKHKKKGTKNILIEHRKVCHEFAFFGVQQIKQQKAKDA